MHCPNRETAASVASAAGQTGELLTDTVVKLCDERAAKILEKKLRQMGIFVGKRPLKIKGTDAIARAIGQCVRRSREREESAEKVLIA